MRLVAIAAALTLAWSASAWAQTSITLDASHGNPIVDAEINDRAVQFEVDLRMASGIALSQAAAERLRVRRVPFVAIAIALEGGSSMRGRVARPRVVVGEEDSRAWTGIFPAPVTRRADGVIGPSALPYDVVTVVLGPEQAGARSIVLPVAESDNNYWMAETQAGSETILVMFDVGGRQTILNRTAARRFDASGEIESNGELVDTHYMLGLSTMMQPVDTELAFQGISFGPTLARTNAPLLGADEEDAVVVQGEPADPPRAGVAIGREALERAGCTSISVDRRARRMTLRCAP
jgi:hypothetical protein